MNWLARLKQSQATQNDEPVKPPTVAIVATTQKLAANDSEPPANPNAWRELAQAHHNHHFSCPTCIAAGRGAVYCLRCGVGAALWTSYENTGT